MDDGNGKQQLAMHACAQWTIDQILQPTKNMYLCRRRE